MINDELNAIIEAQIPVWLVWTDETDPEYKMGVWFRGVIQAYGDTGGYLAALSEAGGRVNFDRANVKTISGNQLYLN